MLMRVKILHFLCLLASAQAFLALGPSTTLSSSRSQLQGKWCRSAQVLKGKWGRRDSPNLKLCGRENPFPGKRDTEPEQSALSRNDYALQDPTASLNIDGPMELTATKKLQDVQKKMWTQADFAHIHAISGIAWLLPGTALGVDLLFQATTRCSHSAISTYPAIRAPTLC